MDSRHTGFEELLYLQTARIRVTVKGKAMHPALQGAEEQGDVSVTKVRCMDSYDLFLQGESAPTGPVDQNRLFFLGNYEGAPMFYEQQNYELVIELLDPGDDHTISFWHDNFNVRNKISQVGRNRKILSGVINFDNEIGLTDLVVRVDGQDYLTLTGEVFPTKLSYKEDYRALVEDVTKEVFSLIFDFLKKTYSQFRQDDRTSSGLAEFFAVIRKIYDDFAQAADVILSRPHHQLAASREVLPGYQIRQTDSKSIRWLQKHPEQALRSNGRILVARTMAVKKQVTYDTQENRLTKYILQKTIRKLQQFKKSSKGQARFSDQKVMTELDSMIQGLHRRCSTSVLQDVDADASSVGMSLVFSMAPGYRELYKYYLMLSRGLSVSGDIFDISVKDLAVLYEYWCFIKLNALVKEKYELVSQDVIQVERENLTFSLKKGQKSGIRYQNPRTGEKIMLSYNPEKKGLPTVTQRPDNILTLEKRDGDTKYEYVFDAKYRINPAIEGTDYYRDYGMPGPEVENINTMHRYRDAIVCEQQAASYERTMFGAYVLFPYRDEAGYQKHKFYESIEKVNIGGLPFLPSATTLVSQLLDELIADSPQSAFERTVLPLGIEEKLAKVDWSVRDVLVGNLESPDQLLDCLENRRYYVPAAYLKESQFPIHRIALSQSIRLFGRDSGIRYSGEVVHSRKICGAELAELLGRGCPEAWYYLFEVNQWADRNRRISQKENGITRLILTNQFLLEHSTQVPELRLRSGEEYRLYYELKRVTDSTEISEGDAGLGFLFGGALVTIEGDEICVVQGSRIREHYSVKEFRRRPNATIRCMLKALCPA